MQPQNGEHSGNSVPQSNLPPGVVQPSPGMNLPDPPEAPLIAGPSYNDELWLRPTAGVPTVAPGGFPGSDVSTGQIPGPRAPGRLWVALAVGFSVALLAGILVFVVGGGANAPLPPAAFVQAAAHKTAGEKTADLSLSGSVNAGGINVPVSGTGEMDFVMQRASFEMNMNVEGISVSLNEIVTRSDVLERISGSALSTGQKWIETPIPETRDGVALENGGEDPANQLALLSERGASVKKLGTLEIGGVKTTEYSVVPSKKLIVQGIKEELSSPDVSATVKQELEQFQNSPPSLKLDAWIDGSGLLRRIEENVSVPAVGASSADSGNFVFSFERYGAPAKINLPPLNDVTSISGLESSTADRVAQSNLTNALTEAKALYQVNQSYASGNKPYSVHDFSSQAPEFSWTTDSCKPGSSNCISFEVLDVGSSGDHQGVALSAYSSSGTCWYAVDLEVNPTSLPKDPKAIWTAWNGGANVGLSAGVFYARTPGTPQNACAASDVLHPGFVVGWGQSYSSPGTIG